MPRGHELGHEGEEKATRLLEEKGYRILARNFRAGHAEVDIIAQKEKLVIFVEVKTRSSAVESDSTINKKKVKLLAFAASEFMYRNQLDLFMRFDAILVEFRFGAWSCRHIEDAFFPFE